MSFHDAPGVWAHGDEDQRESALASENRSGGQRGREVHTRRQARTHTGRQTVSQIIGGRKRGGVEKGKGEKNRGNTVFELDFSNRLVSAVKNDERAFENTSS